MATSSISDRTPAIDQHPTNNSQSAKRQFINRYLADFAKQDHRLHYTDKKMFDGKSACEIIKFYKKQPILNPVHHALMYIHAINKQQAQVKVAT